MLRKLFSLDCADLTQSTLTLTLWQITRNLLVRHLVCKLNVYFCLCCLFRAVPMAYGSSQARGRIRAVAASLYHNHSKARSEPHLQPTPQLTEFLTHWVRPEIERTPSWLLSHDGNSCLHFYSFKHMVMGSFKNAREIIEHRLVELEENLETTLQIRKLR